ncbi:MAG: zinc-dependent alcohol dehydrogenase [Christensenellales bacterium]
MKAVIYEAPGKWHFEDRPKPKIENPDDVLLKVKGVGICGTDLHILDERGIHPSKPGIILGHEYTAVVEAVGSGVTEFKKGDCVLIDPHPSCGVCEFCREDRPDRCSNLYYPVDHPEFANHPITRGIFRDGAFTSYTCVPAHSLYHISSDVPFELAALAEPIACVACAVGKLGIKAGDTACVIGCGPIGLLFISLLRLNGVTKVIASEPSAYRREKALKCGASLAVNPLKEDLLKVVRDETNGDGVDISVEAVGAELNTAIDVVRNGGKVMQFGHDEIAMPPIRVGQIVRKDLEIHGAFIGKYMFKRVAELIESGALPLREIATHKMPLSQLQDAIDMLRRGEALKIVIYPEEY